MRNAGRTCGYQELVREAHDLAELLKQTRPNFRDEIHELQAIVRRAHLELDGLQELTVIVLESAEESGRPPALNHMHYCHEAAALNNLRAALESLGLLMHLPDHYVPMDPRSDGHV